MGLLRRGEFSQKCFQRRRRIGRSFQFLIDIPEFQSDTCQHLPVCDKTLQQLLPIVDLAVLKDQLQSDVFKEQVFSGTQDSREVVLLLFRHGKVATLEENSLPPCVQLLKYRRRPPCPAVKPCKRLVTSTIQTPLPAWLFSCGLFPI